MEEISDISRGVVKHLNTLWKENELLDFSVSIDGITIQCHRVILGACSEFFRCLFRSNMKETNDNVVTVKGMSVETFKLILKCLYTGENLLTVDIVVDVWKAVHQLQIDFMIDVCERFVVDTMTLNNFEKLYTTSVLLDSTFVMEAVYCFMLKNFEQVSSTNTYLNLPYTKLAKLISSQDLLASSEDVVLLSVLNWVENESSCNYTKTYFNGQKNIIKENKKEIDIEAEGNASDLVNILYKNTEESIEQNSFDACENKTEIDKNEINLDENQINFGVNSSNREFTEDNGYEAREEELVACTTTIPFSSSLDRKSKLADILTCVRTCLVSPTLICKVFNHPLVSKDEKSRQIIFNANLYKITTLKHGHWPSSALHRNSSEMGHFGAYIRADCKRISLISAASEEWFYMPSCSSLKNNVNVCVFDNELYIVGSEQNYSNYSSLFVYSGKSWTHIATIPNQNVILVPLEHFIYALNVADKTLYRVNPKDRTPIVENLPKLNIDMQIANAYGFERNIIIFGENENYGLEETAVFLLDLNSYILTRLDNLDGQAKNIICFKDDSNFYILQANGNLWSLLSTISETVNCVFTAKLWEGNKTLNGAICYNKKLIIHANNPSTDPVNSEMLRILPGVFDSIKHWGNNHKCSAFVPVLLPKASVKKK